MYSGSRKPRLSREHSVEPDDKNYVVGGDNREATRKVCRPFPAYSRFQRLAQSAIKRTERTDMIETITLTSLVGGCPRISRET